jgi:hypothetical protein
MTPGDFLLEQAKNVEQALTETLRYDYGPKPTWDYYKECRERLDRIKHAITNTSPSDLVGIEARLDELSYLCIWISLIERSRLGEFSWPFAEALRRMAETLLTETSLSGLATPPIVHVVSDAEGYLIHYETPSASSKHRFAFIAFPRPLKHHVLLHSLFGHELGHTALHSVGAGTILQRDVLAPLERAGPLASLPSMMQWLNDANAPTQVKRELRQYHSTYHQQYSFLDHHRSQWLDEMICDLFGLMLFGPGFVAAHFVYLRPMHANPYELGLSDSTHPPYATRQRLLVQAMRIAGWDQPVANDAQDGDCRLAEEELFRHTLIDQYDNWATIFSDAQINAAIAGIKNVFAAYGGLGYVKPEPQAVSQLVGRLKRRLPPIRAELSRSGKPTLHDADIAHYMRDGYIGSGRSISRPSRCRFWRRTSCVIMRSFNRVLST